ncbi:MAG: O-Antigen ligase [Lacunisphaera sp.]|nr:O-Antigen ligase [Lacunisphaera sp.]
MNGAESSPSAPRRSRHPGRASAIEKLALAHFGMLIVFTTWAFGGQAPWVRQVIAGWGAVGVVLFFIASALHVRPPGERHPAMRWLWPLLIYDLIVVTAGFNPSFNEVIIGGQASLVLGAPKPWLPSSARPMLAWRELWHFNVIVLSCFNLYLVLRNRRGVRAVLFLLGINAVALAIFGTFQKLAGFKDLWFGLVPAPNLRFFSTFVYANHWGAFTLLNIAACLALFYHFVRRGNPRGFWHSPAPLGALGILLLATTIPLSGSRSSTILIGILLAGGLLHLMLRVIRRRRELRESSVLPVAGIVVVTTLALAAVGYLSREVITQRARTTSEQIATAANEGTLNSRLTLYRDTWRMAAEKPWFGWGLDSYAHVFRIFNSQRTAETWWWIPFYAKAHSDWLQSLAEVGFIGTALVALLVLLPLRAVRWRQVDSILPRYLLAGNALVLLYAWLEFPFANSAVLMTFCAVFYCAIRYATLDLEGQRAATP